MIVLGEVECGTRPKSDLYLSKLEIDKYLNDKVKTFNSVFFLIDYLI